mgnify:CR=1 FL=1
MLHKSKSEQLISPHFWPNQHNDTLKLQSKFLKQLHLTYANQFVFKINSYTKSRVKQSTLKV